MLSDIDLLAQVKFFRDLSTTELATIAAQFFREDKFAPNVSIFHEGDRAVRVWVVKSGQIKIIKYGHNGKEIVIEVISPGEIFGGAAMLMSHHPATAQALSEVTTISITVEEYRYLLQKYPIIAIHILETFGKRMIGLLKTRVISHERVERRVAHMLLKLADKSRRETAEGVVVDIRLTRQDIADLADTSLETAIRVMSKFRKEGLVKTLRGGYVLILDYDKMRELSHKDSP